MNVFVENILMWIYFENIFFYIKKMQIFYADT